MGQPPTSEEVVHRKELASIGFGETLNLEKVGRDTYEGNWVNIATFALLHPHSYFCVANGVYSTDELRRFKYREQLPNIDFAEITTIEFNEKQSIEATKKYGLLSDHASQTDSNRRPTVLTYGTDETFWQALGAIELAKQGYIVFPEALSRRWTHGVPDLTVFRLGGLQETLADIGLIPGGAPLQAIQLRAIYRQYDSTEINADETIGAVEAKNEGKGQQGIRELIEYRTSSRDAKPYLDGDIIEYGWLVSPMAQEERSLEDTEVGVVTWDKDQALYFSPQQQRVNVDRQLEEIRAAKRFVLDTVLRHYDTPYSLETTIENSLYEPERLYSILS
jgi:hypothetical protein